MAQMIFPIITDFDRKLPYFFAGVGVNYEQERIDRPTGHTHYQWIQTRRGEGVLQLRGKEYLLREGTGMFLFPGEPHTYHKTKEEWQVDWIIFEGAGISDFAGKVLELNRSEVGVISEPERLSCKIEEVFGMAASDEPMKNSICSDMVYSLLMEILRKATFQNEKAIAGNQKKLDGVISHINRQYQNDLSLEDLAELAGLTPQYLCTVFKQYTSQTPFQYINMVRISKSKELLLAVSDMPIKEIATQTGFHDVSYFCKIFRKLEGKSPLEFRKSR